MPSSAPCTKIEWSRATSLPRPPSPAKPNELLTIRAPGSARSGSAGIDPVSQLAAPKNADVRTRRDAVHGLDVERLLDVPAHRAAAQASGGSSPSAARSGRLYWRGPGWDSPVRRE